MNLKDFADRISIATQADVEQGREYAEVRGDGCLSRISLSRHAGDETYSFFLQSDSAGTTPNYLSVYGAWNSRNLTYSINGGDAVHGTHETMPEFEAIVRSPFFAGVTPAQSIWRQTQAMKDVSADSAALQGKLDDFFAKHPDSKETETGVSFTLHGREDYWAVPLPPENGFAAVEVSKRNGKTTIVARRDPDCNAEEVVSVSADGTYDFKFMLGSSSQVQVPVSHTPGRLDLTSLNAALDDDDGFLRDACGPRFLSTPTPVKTL